MKALPLLFIGALSATTLAQNPAPPQTVRNLASPVTSAPVTEAPQPSRFDLDFPGGTPKQLLAALEKSLGRPVNVVMGEPNEQVLLPSIRVRNATINDVFTAITTATRREVPMPMGGGSIAYKVVQSQFVPSGKTINDDTVWSFVSDQIESKRIAPEVPRPKRELRYFQMRDYLSDKLTVQDITTAIRSGWEILRVAEMPELKYHAETGILIAAGEESLLDQIPMVLEQLPKKSDTVEPGPLPNLPEPGKPLPQPGADAPTPIEPRPAKL